MNRSAEKLQKRAARVGFDWHDTAPVIEKIAEELAEVEDAGADGNNNLLSLECDDLLFACVNLARHMGIDAESALREANAKFENRFRRLEEVVVREGLRPEQMSLAQLDQIWQRVKKRED